MERAGRSGNSVARIELFEILVHRHGVLIFVLLERAPAFRRPPERNNFCGRRKRRGYLNSTEAVSNKQLRLAFLRGLIRDANDQRGPILRLTRGGDDLDSKRSEAITHCNSAAG